MTYRFLLMLKPEANLAEVDRGALLDILHDHLKIHKVNVLGSKEVVGSQFRAMRGLDSVYPRLSLIAKVGEKALAASERNRLLAEMKGLVPISAQEACEKFRWSSTCLCAKGDKERVVKLGPGAYAAQFSDLGYAVLNHFFPEFEHRFYSDSAVITAFECEVSKPELYKLRDMLVGAIDPRNAKFGSLRASLLALSNRLRLGDVTTARNFVHISAGYLEAMMQLSFFFPHSSFFDRLRSTGVQGSVSHSEGENELEGLCRLFAESEQLEMRDALHAAKRWLDECEVASKQRHL